MQTLKRSLQKQRKPVRRDKKRLKKLWDATLVNSKYLLDEAKLLFKNAHYPRSFFLAYTAFEELGKMQIIADYENG